MGGGGRRSVAAAIGTGVSVLGFLAYIILRSKETRQPAAAIEILPAPIEFQPAAIEILPAPIEFQPASIEPLPNPNTLYEKQWNSKIHAYAELHVVYYLCIYLWRRYGGGGHGVGARKQFLEDFFVNPGHLWRQGVVVSTPVLKRLQKEGSLENMFLVGGANAELMKLYLDLQKQHTRLQELQAKLQAEEGITVTLPAPPELPPVR